MRFNDRPRRLPARRTSASSRRRPAFDFLEDRIILSRITVDTLSDDLAPPGGLVSLRAAITRADADPDADTIDFAPGLAKTILLGSALPHISADTTVEGPGADAITVDGGGEGSNRSVFAVDAGVTSTISGLTITGSDARSFSNGFLGGGVYNQGRLALDDVVITGNSAIRGGGIYNSPSGSLTVSRSTLSGNFGVEGAGAYSYHGSLTISDSVISGNGRIVGHDFSHDTTSGGGVEAYGGSLVVESTLITGNTANGGGGILASNLTALTLADCTISDNVAVFFGGGVELQNTHTEATVTTCKITGNTSGQGGGLFVSLRPPGRLELSDSTISGNVASADREVQFGYTAFPKQGGSVCVYSGTVELDDVAITGNAATLGADLYNKGTATVTDGSVSENTPPTREGGVANHGTLTVDGTSVRDNTATTGGGIWNDADASILAGAVADNTASGQGGGIANVGTMTIGPVTIAGNSAASGGGA